MREPILLDLCNGERKEQMISDPSVFLGSKGGDL